MYLNLDGRWELHTDEGTKEVTVPGLISDPTVINPSPVTLSRSVELPAGDWNNATIYLKGARFTPEVYINDKSQGRLAGGMGPLRLQLSHLDVKPESQIKLSIKLWPLDQIDPKDASRIPDADLWRSNVSCCLWDSVILRLHGDSQLTRLIPFAEPEKDRVMISWQIDRPDDSLDEAILFEFTDLSGKSLLKYPVEQVAEKGRTRIYLHGVLDKWTPEAPNLYRLNAYLLRDGHEVDLRSMNFGFRRFDVDNEKQSFTLNGQPVRMRGASVVWHRWLRDPEAHQLAFDWDWFETHIIKRLKDSGANTLRFHLGLPPEKLLSLCDRHGLLVQTEWSFFHGVQASQQSMMDQWQGWFDLCFRHPSCVLQHPWNETDPESLNEAWAAINELETQYPPMVLSHRDVLHMHRYWWSLFENIGLYYDELEDFGKPLMVDEYGGNYLDGHGDIGAYPANAGSFRRFLGDGHDREERLTHQAMANARISEYWRMLGAAGFSNFCALGSPEDGNHHFLSPLNAGKPKPVWSAMVAAYSPTSILLRMWDRHLKINDQHLFHFIFCNDTHENRSLVGNFELIRISDRNGADLERVYSETISTAVEPDSQSNLNISVELPGLAGWYEARITLMNPEPDVVEPVISKWQFQLMSLEVSEHIQINPVYVPAEEQALIELFESLGILVVQDQTQDIDLCVCSKHTWERLNQGDTQREEMERFLEQGGDVVLLDIGPKDLGLAYRKKTEAFYQTDGVPKGFEHELSKTRLPGGLTCTFETVAEPESCAQFTPNGQPLMKHMDHSACWIWNGYRAGLVLPAVEMRITGMSKAGILRLWTDRGADADVIRSGQGVMYSLEGHYAFSQYEDNKVAEQLIEEVKFLMEDAPALSAMSNQLAEPECVHLGDQYKEAPEQGAIVMTPLIKAGRDLHRDAMIEIGFSHLKGRLVISQLLTDERIVASETTSDFYRPRFDPAACQLLLNLMEELNSSRG